MTLIYAYQDRGLTRDLTIQDANGNTITPADDDLVRVIIGHEGDTPKLTVVSGSPTANGSSLSKGATNRLRLDASDLALIEPGVYTFIFDLFDFSDAAEWKNVQRQIFSLEES